MNSLPIQVTQVNGDHIRVRLPDQTEITLPASVCAGPVKEGDTLSLLALRGSDLMNELLRDDGKKEA